MQALRASVAALLAVSAMSFGPAVAQSDRCVQGYVWREAFPGDHVCVNVGSREQAARDNREASTRVQPAGGAYGPNTCRPGWVWRVAKPGDLVCVTPEIRAQTATENAEAASHRVMVSPAAPTPPVASSVRQYRTGEWSAWTRSQDIQYRYRWGLDAGDRKYATSVEAIFELKNAQKEKWRGSARANCSGGKSGRSKDVELQPGETQEVRFLAPNCGNLKSPWFNAEISRAYTL
jgi:hypothetical protein